ncbi:MAG: glutathione S-transferase family protein [Rhodomicrobium sp.]
MIALYSYPGLFGVADNNPYGLKVFAFLKLCNLPFRQEHILDPKHAPRAQLPYISDGAAEIGDSDAIVAYLIRKYELSIDAALTQPQRDTGLLIRRMLDDLYWVMSYSRWQDKRYYPRFRDAFLKTHAPHVTPDSLEAARKYNVQRYFYQGISRYDPASVYERGLADLQVLANLVPASGYISGPAPGSIDASIYGFVANIYFYSIETPLKTFVASQANLVRHCGDIHAAVSGPAQLA